ncbi:MAG: hypothetical protein R3C44_18035 [Chloroflexota bacterium]
MPPDFVAEVAARYIGAYERLTGRPFTPAAQPAAPELHKHLPRRSHRAEAVPHRII